MRASVAIALILSAGADARAEPALGTDQANPRGDDGIECETVLPDAVVAKFGLERSGREHHVYAQPACERKGDEDRCWIHDVTCTLDGKLGSLISVSYWCDSLQSVSDLDQSATASNDVFHSINRLDDDYRRQKGLARRAWVSAKTQDVLMLSSAKDCRVQINYDGPRGTARQRLEFARAVDRTLAAVRPVKRR